MYGDIDAGDIALLNAISHLHTAYQKECSDYIRYLLTKQYKKELMVSIFNNQLLNSLLKSTLQLTERDDFQIVQIENRVRQMRELYFGIFERIHLRYCELIDGLDSSEIVRDFGCDSFANIDRACLSNNRLLVRMEITEFYEGYHKFASQKEARKIFAV